MVRAMSAHPVTIDCQYLSDQFAAAYLLREQDEFAFVEANTAHAVPRLLEALQAAGGRPEQVRWVVVTHVHLDHAGGASALMEACPNATLLCHPRAAPHLVDPSRLVASATKVYGAEAFEALYGTIRPVAPERVRVMEDEETLAWGDRTWRFLHTRGHANHHLCLHDSASGGVYTGDTFGLAYPSLQRAGLFVFPSTSPTDFDPEEALRSVERVAAIASRLYLTHFGEVTEVAGAAAQLRRHIAFCGALLDRAVASALEGPELGAWAAEVLRGYYATETRAIGLDLTDDDWSLLRLDLDINGQGIAHVAMKRRTASTRT